MTTAEKVTQRPMAVVNSLTEGGKIRKKLFPLINEEKLETQKGIANRRKVCHLSARADPLLLMLRISATPMSALMPREFSQMLGDESKW
jgi:hypothetical protein